MRHRRKAQLEVVPHNKRVGSKTEKTEIGPKTVKVKQETRDIPKDTDQTLRHGDVTDENRDWGDQT